MGRASRTHTTWYEPFTDDGIIERAVAFVLSRFWPAERGAAVAGRATAAQAVLVWVRSGVEACMNRFNGPADEKKEKKPKKEKPPGKGSDPPEALPPDR